MCKNNRGFSEKFKVSAFNKSFCLTALMRVNPLSFLYQPSWRTVALIGLPALPLRKPVLLYIAYTIKLNYWK